MTTNQWRVYTMQYTGQTDDSHPKQDGERFYHATQNNMQFKTYELFLEFSI